MPKDIRRTTLPCRSKERAKECGEGSLVERGGRGLSGGRGKLSGVKQAHACVHARDSVRVGALCVHAHEITYACTPVYTDIRGDYPDID